MRRVWQGVCLAVCMTPRFAAAQVPPAATDMLRRLLATREFSAQAFGGVRWVDGGSAYTTVEPSALVPGSSDLVRYVTATGARTVLVSARQLIPAGARGPLDIDDYEWARGDSLLLVFTNTRKVWRRNTRGDYWVLNRKSGGLRKVGAADSPP